MLIVDQINPLVILPLSCTALVEYAPKHRSSEKSGPLLSWSLAVRKGVCVYKLLSLVSVVFIYTPPRPNNDKGFDV